MKVTPYSTQGDEAEGVEEWTFGHVGLWWCYHTGPSDFSVSLVGLGLFFFVSVCLFLFVCLFV